MGEPRGLVTDIQRMSVHDGPGIRTTVFLKGCNLRCAWCHNPETIGTEPEYVVNPALCIGCGRCEEGCYSGARRLCGTEMGVGEVLAQVLLDRPYYGDDGGLTISGGEPFMQPGFTAALARAAREAGVGVGVETNLSLPRGRWEPAVPSVDVFMVDVKCLSDETHRAYVGAGNAQILANLRELDAMLDATGASLVVRTPAVPGVNDDPEELDGIARVAAGLRHLAYYEVLPYHTLGLSKRVEGRDFIREFPLPDKARLRATLEGIHARRGVPIRFANRLIGE